MQFMDPTYGLRNKKTGKVMRISAHTNPPDAEFCGSETVTFSTSDYDPIFEVETAAQAMRAILQNPGWYNSSREVPSWDTGFDPADYEIVRFTKEMHIIPTVLPPILKGELYHFDPQRNGFARKITSKKDQEWADAHIGANNYPDAKRGIVVEVGANPFPLNDLVGKRIFSKGGQYFDVLGVGGEVGFGDQRGQVLYTSDSHYSL